MFDCLHDMGDPVGAARHVRGTLKDDGTWMIVEPNAGDRVEDNLNPVGRLLRVLDAPVHAGLALPGSAQHPVTAVLEQRGERIHPASAQLANESAHMRSESDGHHLNCFQAFRRMDEILTANFMVFHDVARKEQYDLWIGDEAWEIDHYLHAIAEAIAQEIGRKVEYRPVATDGAARAAAIIAELL